MQRLMAKGYSRERAYKIAERVHRMRQHRGRKAVGSMFAGFGEAGRAAAAHQAYESGAY